MKMICFLLFFAFAMANTGISYESLTGNWTNELNSNCSFLAKEDGSITGSYNTAVGNVRVSHPIHGQWIQGIKHVDTLIVSFIVMWEHPEKDKPRSATTWNGQLFVGEKGTPQLFTQWLLVREKEKRSIWENTIVQSDVFTKND